MVQPLVYIGLQVRTLEPARFSSQPTGERLLEKMQQAEAAVHYCLGL